MVASLIPWDKTGTHDECGQILAAFGVLAARVNFVALGLALWMLSVLVK